MYCTRCGTLNTRSNKFCHECGSRLVEPKAPAAAGPERAETAKQEIDQKKVGDLLYLAFQHYESGNTDAALEAAREAQSLNPDSTSAHSLMSLIHEQRGDLEQAIAETGDA